MTKILLIDDDPDLCTLVSALLSRDGYQVQVAYEGQEGLEKANQFQPDLILLDVMMPGESGWDLCQRLREVGDIPIIFLSARGAESDIVRGLHSGADDYVSKPFRRHELVARIEAVLRRVRASKPEEDTIFNIGDLTINHSLWEVDRDGKAIHLTPTEFKLLLLLEQNAERPFTHHELISTVWGPAQEGNHNLLKVYIRQLRRKVEPDPNRPQYIHTKRGIGYHLTAPKDSSSTK